MSQILDFLTKWWPMLLAIGGFTTLANRISAITLMSVVLSLQTTGPMQLRALTSQDMYLAGSFLVLLSALTVVGTLVSDIATAVWGAGTRTLSTWSQIVLDVWASPTRTLSSFGTLVADIWAAAGHPNGVFRMTPDQLVALTGAPVADVVQAPA